MDATTEARRKRRAIIAALRIAAEQESKKVQVKK